MTISPATKTLNITTFFILEIIASILINLGLGYWIGKLHMRGHNTISLFQSNGIAVDVIITCAALGFLLPFIATPIISARKNNGKTPTISPDQLPNILKHVPKKLLPKSICIAVFSVLLLPPIIIAVIFFCQISTISAKEFYLLKALYSASIGAVITPIALWPILVRN